MLLNADPEPSQPVLTTPVGSVAGRVCIGGRNAVGFQHAKVIALGHRLGAMTDSTGAYVIAGVPAIRIELKVEAIGFEPMVSLVDVVAGQTVRKDFWLTPKWSRYDEVKDSLEALGQWPPRLDPGLLEHMRAATDVRVFRLDPDKAAHDMPPDPAHRIGPWPIVGEAPRPSRSAVTKLVDALGVSPFKLPRMEGSPIKPCEGFSPGIDVRFTHAGVPVDVLLCYRCGEISIWRGGKGVQAGDFSDARFVDFAKRAFPNDPEIRRLASAAQQH